jgi:hypothetical protein
VAEVAEVAIIVLVGTIKELLAMLALPTVAMVKAKVVVTAPEVAAGVAGKMVVQAV